MTLQIARLIGAAGSGKTTELLKIMEAALPKLSNDPLRLGFASFTRAARAEAVNRAAAAWSVPTSLLDKQGWFRTVHSTAKRCLGVTGKQLLGGSVADTAWVSEALGCHVTTTIDDDTGRQKFIGGDAGAALTSWDYARSTLQPLGEAVRKLRVKDSQLPEYAAVVRYVERYESAKRMDNRCDFSDLLLRLTGVRCHPIDGVYRVEPEGELPPVSAWIFDEQQDASPLLDAACKRLVSAKSVAWVYAAGDPFQCIFGFAGSSSECFLGWPADKERIMPKSYRCPKPILELGERCLRRMHKGYFDRNVAPAGHEGHVYETETEVPLNRAKPDEDWLFVARTNYDAKRLYASLNALNKPARWVKQGDELTARHRGLQALYSLEHGDGVSSADWNHAMQLLPVTDATKQPMLARGAKTTWFKKHGDERDVIFLGELDQVGANPELVSRIQSGRWVGLVDNSQEWRSSAKKWGPHMASMSGIRVGTIHSVKGMEADNVAFLTTVSKRIEEGSMDDPDQHDEECRIAYVAVTRARRNLYVVNELQHSKRVRCMEVM